MPADNVPNSQLQYLTVNDFRPGIVTLPSFNLFYDMPPGTAASGTSGCYGNELGVLVPMPRHVASLDQVFSAGITVATGVACRPVGLFTVGPLAVLSAGPTFAQNTNFQDELHFMFQGSSTVVGGKAEFQWNIRKLYFSAIPADIVTTDTGAASAGVFIHGCTGVTARIRHATFSQPGFPTFVTEWSEAPASGWNDAYYFYPNPNATNSDTPFSTLNFGPVQLAVLSGRILFLNVRTYTHGANGGVYFTNEDIMYTDPPNSDVTTANQPTVLDAENPSGFNSWGSLSYGELFMVRRSGGAVLIDGDIYAPNVSILRGVKSVGNLMNICSPTDSGLVYCVDSDGAYLWEGGNTSKKISTIDDRFYDRLNGNPVTGVKVKHTRWGRFIVFPNGWSYDCVTGAWWQLDGSADIALVESGKGSPNLLFTAPDSFTPPATCTVRVYNNTTTPTNTFTWVSQSIHLLDGQLFDVMEVSVSVATIAPNGGTVTMTVEDANGTDQTVANWTFASTFGANPRVRRARTPCGVTNINHLVVKLTATAVQSNEQAPSIIDFSVGWTPSSVQAQNG